MGRRWAFCLAAAIFAAPILGARPGSCTPPADPNAYLRLDPDNPEHQRLRALLESLGYTVSDSGRVYPPSDPNGAGGWRALTQGEASRLMAPVDLRDPQDLQRLDAMARWRLQTSGAIRVDEGAGRVLVRVSDSESRPMLRAELLSLLRAMTLSDQHLTLEQIYHHSQNCTCFLSRQRIDALAGLERAGLPADLLQAIRVSRSAQAAIMVAAPLMGPTGLTAPLVANLADRLLVGGPAYAAYTASMRYFDQSRSFQELGAAALPAAAPFLAAQRHPAYFNAAERRLGGLLAADVKNFFSSGGPVAQRLWDRLDGHLPAFTLIRMDAASGSGGRMLPAALYSPQTRSITFIHDHIYPALRERALALGLDRDLVEGWRRNPNQLIEFLAINDPENPNFNKAADLRRSMISHFDTILLHEMVHYWQHRRGRSSEQMVLGNVSYYPFEFEREAIGWEIEYLRQKMRSVLRDGGDPWSVLRSPSYAFMASSLEAPQGFRSWHERAYRTLPGAGLGFEEIRDVQATQAEVRRRQLSETADQTPALRRWAANALSLMGLSHGDAALASDQAQYRELAQPDGQAAAQRRLEGALDLSRIWERAENPYQAFFWQRLAAGLLPADHADRAEQTRRLGSLALQAARWLKTPPKDAGREALWQALSNLREFFRAASSAQVRVDGLRALALAMEAGRWEVEVFITLVEARDTARRGGLPWGDQEQEAMERNARVVINWIAAQDRPLSTSQREPLIRAIANYGLFSARAAILADRPGDWAVMYQTLTSIGRLELAAGRGQEALPDLEHALRLARSHRDEAKIAEVEALLARARGR